MSEEEEAGVRFLTDGTSHWRCPVSEAERQCVRSLSAALCSHCLPRVSLLCKVNGKDSLHCISPTDHVTSESVESVDSEF